jgi:DNA-binding response OmpR family regulator
MVVPTLLLVDDAPEIGFLVKRLAGKAGCDVVVCHDVATAQEVLRTLRPHLILLDLNLPGANGLELCAHLRARTGEPVSPITLFGSAARTEDLAAALEAGVDFLLDKDLLARPDAWQARLAEILQMAAGTGPAALVEYRDSIMSPSASTDGITPFNEALQHSAVLRLGIPVVRVLLRRVLHRLSESVPNEGNPPAAEAAVTRWLSPDGLGLAPFAFPPAQRLHWVAACAAALCDQFARVWGFAESRQAREALTAWMHG